MMGAAVQSFHIFVVDDDASARMIAGAALESLDCVMREFADAPALLAALDDIETSVPDLILLDIEMPGMDGIEACRRLRAAGNASTQVLFLSSHNDLETRLAAYDAGGNDFIVKPYELDELARKVGVARQTAAQHSALDVQTQFAQKTAFTAMSSMAEMGVVQDFLRASFACDSLAALAARLFEALRQYDLDGLAKLYGNDTWHCFSSKGACSQLETGILDHAGTLERIFQFGNRLTINYPDITLLVYPLPLDAPDRVGRLRDHLAVLAEGLQMRLQAMKTEQAKRLQSAGIARALDDLLLSLDTIEKSHAAHRLRAAEIDENYLREQVNAFVHLGLSEDQENHLAEMAQRTHAELASLRELDGSVSDQLRGVTTRLRSLLDD